MPIIPYATLELENPRAYVLRTLDALRYVA
jgi:hypothetical protein